MAKNKLSQNYKTKLPKYIDYYLKLIKTSYLALKFYPNIDLYQPIFYYLLIDIYEHLTFIIITNLRILLSSNVISHLRQNKDILVIALFFIFFCSYLDSLLLYCQMCIYQPIFRLSTWQPLNQRRFTPYMKIGKTKNKTSLVSEIWRHSKFFI